MRIFVDVLNYINFFTIISLKRDDKMKKRFKKCIVIAVVVVTLVFIVNIVLAIIFQGDSGANIFTTISGWISGISTIVLGVIALYVNAKYKKDNDDYLKKQDELFWKNEKKSAIELYRDQIVKCYDRFLKLNYLDLLDRLLKNETQNGGELFSVALSSTIQTEKHNMIYTISLCKYYFEFKSELYESYCEYLSKLTQMTMDYNDMVYKKQYEKVDELQELYIKVINNFNIHIGKINIFLSTKLPTKTQNELEVFLKNAYDRQIEWWESVCSKMKN